MSLFIRDVCFHDPDLLILYDGVAYQNPLRVATVNVLASKDGIIGIKNPFINLVNSSYKKKASSGINHNIDLDTLRAIQQRVLSCYAGHFGYTFWDIIAPTHTTIPTEKAVAFTNRSEGYITRQKALKNAAVSALNKNIIKDYSSIFDNVDDVYSIFADYWHLSEKGNTIVAKRLCADILKVFGNRRKG